MKLAAIDIGSNSIHMVIARIDGEGSFEIIAREKEMVHLGERSLSEGILEDEVQNRGLETLRDFRQIAEGYRVDEIIASATSAVRESRNGAQFIDRVRKEVGIDARIIKGTEEGRLIYLGVREVFDFGSRQALIVDIGGGSVEFVLADQRRESIVHSVKLGVRRLHDAFLKGDPPTEPELEALWQHLRESLTPVANDIRERGFDVVLGTSGTIRVLARLIATRRGTEADTYATADLRTIVKELAAMPGSERSLLPGVDDRRRDTILEGGMLFLCALELLGAEGFQTCDTALREGMIVDYLERNRPGLRMAMTVPDPRRRSVLQVGRRMYNSTAHPEQVSRLALRLFDDLQSLHGLGPEWRELLEYGAYLHDVGKIIGGSAHHKHTLYIVKSVELNGFTPLEQLVIANIARYHRRSIPRSRHDEWMALPDDAREGVVRASILLRLANALDQGHQGNIRGLDASYDGECVRLNFESFTAADVEILALRKKAHHLERNFGATLELNPVDTATSLWEAS